uniref:Uncharacterized protein n=1 Tax=Anopheles atroparvus TaxID=41427 RepID=A0AAG5CNP0_ANOAO
IGSSARRNIRQLACERFTVRHELPTRRTKINNPTGRSVHHPDIVPGAFEPPRLSWTVASRW